MQERRIDENIGLAREALERYFADFNIGALTRAKAYLEMAAAEAGRLLGIEAGRLLEAEAGRLSGVSAGRLSGVDAGCLSGIEAGQVLRAEGNSMNGRREGMGSASSMASAVPAGDGAKRDRRTGKLRQARRYPAQGRMRRRAFAVARDFGLKTDDGPAMRAALSRFLGRPIESRRELSDFEWSRVVHGIEQLRLWW